MLFLALLHYVDDYFGADHSECVEVAMDVFARLVRACLGCSAVSASKFACGNPLVILGVEARLLSGGAQFWPAPEKVAKWLPTIKAAIADRQLSPGEANKKAGQLQWSTQRSFRKLGRAMLRPLIEHARGKDSQVGQELLMALQVVG